MPFGVVAAVASGVASVAGAVGIGAATAASIAAVAAPAIVGAGVGAIGSAITGGDPLTGALTGGLSGGLAAGFGPALAGATGLSNAVAGGLTGAAGGALGSFLGGGNPLTGALTGGIGGYALGSSANWGMGAAPGLAAGPGVTQGAGGSYFDPITGNTVALNGAGASGANVANAAGDATQAVTNAAGPVAGNAANSVGGLSKTQLLLGLANAFGATQKPQPINYATPGPNSVQMSPYQTMGLSTAPAPGRSAVDPLSGSTNAYGVTGSGVNPGGPEQTYFRNNSLAAYSPGGVGLAEGGALTKEFTTAAGNNRHVEGPGTSTSDSIPARLSVGEYVLDHKDVSLIGHGNNEKGAKMLDRSRRLLNEGDRTGALNALAA